ncbi:MAG: MucR family transcriptional regulator, partial [Alphaproteobacteria bacterium]|nr:MucR family transcriptional regulator [Alphaproteobacteria bacterium]
MSKEQEGATSASEMLQMTVDVVAAYVSNNTVNSPDLQELIATVHGTLAGLERVARAPGGDSLKPAVPVRRSVTPDY